MWRRWAETVGNTRTVREPAALPGLATLGLFATEKRLGRSMIFPAVRLAGGKKKKSKSKIGPISWLLCDGHCTCKRRQGSTTSGFCFSSCLRLLRLDSCWREVRWWHLRTAVADVGGGVVRLVPAALAPQHATYYTKHYHRSCSAGLHR